MPKWQFCTVVPDIYGSSVWNMVYFTLSADRLVRWLLEFSKICAHLP